MAMRIAFMGTPEFSIPVLKAIAEAGHEIAAVYTQPPRLAGRRGLELTPSPVHKYAKEQGFAVFTPKSLRPEEEKQRFAALSCDVAVVVAYGLLLPKAVLEAPRLGCYNVHASLLPRWRGAAPIQRAIMAGDNETGITIMKMDQGLDTGPIALSGTVPITWETTFETLHNMLAPLGASLMVQALAALEEGKLPLTPQPEEGVTYAEKISKEEARIDWKEKAFAVQSKIRALSPSPGAWCEMEIGNKRERVKLLDASLKFEFSSSSNRDLPCMKPAFLEVHCGDGNVVVLERLQRAGGKALSREQFLRGAVVKAID